MKRYNYIIHRDGRRTTIGLLRRWTIASVTYDPMDGRGNVTAPLGLCAFAVGTRFDIMAARLTAAEGWEL